jgi:hypothetical protein
MDGTLCSLSRLAPSSWTPCAPSDKPLTITSCAARLFHYADANLLSMLLSKDYMYTRLANHVVSIHCGAHEPAR